MPLTAIIASKDRAAQLDLLLRSVTCHADDLIDSTAVVWICSDTDYEQAYTICEKDHPSVNFYQEDYFRTDIYYQVEQADDYVMFLTDDSYFYRDLPEIDPCAALTAELDVLCFSLRLGNNTSKCYPLKSRWQRFPEFKDNGGYLVWEWATGEADFGYPGSMDGHIFRQRDLLNLIRNDDQWWNPNTLEDALCKGVFRLPRGSMACFEKSILVGIPANRTSSSHPGNRYGEQFFVDHRWLNDEYLKGRRIQFPDTPKSWVMAAHMEMNLEVF
jgi:hypothetical protein